MLDRENRAAWQKHPNFHGPAATLLAIHDQFRDASKRLAELFDGETAPDLRWVARAFRPVAQTLHHHHRAEEALLFPMLGRRTGTTPQTLVSDHEELTTVIAAVESSLARDGDREGAKAAVATFDEVLVRHLEREEQLVIPVLLELTPDQAWALIHDAGG